MKLPHVAKVGLVLLVQEAQGFKCDPGDGAALVKCLDAHLGDCSEFLVARAEGLSSWKGRAVSLWENIEHMDKGRK